MRRALIAATVAVSFFATNLLAAETAAPLAPGKPAGVQKAQDYDWTSYAWIGLGVGAAILLGLSTGQSDHAPPPTLPTTTAT
jgi:hypothetical protein